MSFESLDSTLRKRFFQAQFTSAYIVSRSQEVVGAIGRVKSFRDGRLIIEAPAGVAAVEALMARDSLKLKINERLGREVVQEIIVRAGSMLNH